MVTQAYPRRFRFQEHLQKEQIIPQGQYQPLLDTPAAPTQQIDNTIAICAVVLGVVGLVIFGGLVLVYMKRN